MNDPRIRRPAAPADAMTREEALKTPGLICELWRNIGAHATRLGYGTPNGTRCGDRGL